MRSGTLGVCEYDVVFTELSDFDQYASNFLKPPRSFEILLYTDSFTPVFYLLTFFRSFDMNTSQFNTENNL